MRNEGGGVAQSRAKALLPWGLAALVLVSLWAALRDLDFQRIVVVLRSANLALVLGAVAVNLTLNTYARVKRRVELVRAAASRALDLTFRDWAGLYFASVAGNNLLPARAGDVLFAFEARKRLGLGLGVIATAQLAEKLVEILSLWALSPSGLIFANASPMLRSMLLTFVAGGSIVLFLLVVFVRRITSPRFEAVARIATWGVATRAVSWSLAQDISDIAMVGLVATAVDIHVGPFGWLLVYLAVNLASVLPSAPGQIGLIEAGAVLALIGLGIGQSEAVAFSLLYHAAHFIPTTLAGAWPLTRLLYGRVGSAPSL